MSDVIMHYNSNKPNIKKKSSRIFYLDYLFVPYLNHALKQAVIHFFMISNDSRFFVFRINQFVNFYRK